MKRVWLLGAALLVAGCAGGGVIGYERTVVGGGAGLPETVARARQDAVTPPGRRWLGLAVRSFERDAAGAIVEIPARCSIEAGTLTAEIATPGRLVIPDLGPDAPVITATCGNGLLAGRNSVEPDFGWDESGGNSAQRVVWGGGWWQGGVRTGPLRYPDLDVGLRPRP
jgi:hypothetical protein